MNDYKLFINDKDVSNKVSNLSWNNNIDSLGTELSFSISYFKVRCGDIITLFNDKKKIFLGVVLTVNGVEDTVSISSYDFSIYLNKSETIDIRQMRNIRIDMAIRNLCNSIGISCTIKPIPSIVTKIFTDKTISDIIVELLELAYIETGDKYRMEMINNKLFISKYKDLKIDISKCIISSIDINSSIEDMRNSIIVSSDDVFGNTIVIKKEDNESISKYGLLQDVSRYDDKNESQLNNIANNRLKELNRETRKISIELLGNDNITSGRVITFKNKKYELDGDYLITACSHSINNGAHNVNIELKGVI